MSPVHIQNCGQINIYCLIISSKRNGESITDSPFFDIISLHIRVQTIKQYKHLGLNFGLKYGGFLLTLQMKI